MGEYGQGAFRERTQSGRDDAEYYREYADQLRVLAEAEPTGSRHEALVALVREYDHLAAPG